MSIIVVCPGCRKRFQVSEKFAGRSGPCPQCKTQIKVPTKDEEVKVHEPKDTTRGRRGHLVGKPIAITDAKWNPVVAAAIGAALLTVFMVAWFGGELFRGNLLAQGIGLLLVSPPLVVAGYTFLHDSEVLQPYHGVVLYVRAGICSLAYIVLWWIYGYVAEYVMTGDLWNWLFVAPPFFVAGGMVALICLDLDFGSGFFHYCFYVLVTVLLRAAAGMGWVWEVPGQTAA